MTFSDFVNQGIIGWYLSEGTDSKGLFLLLFFGGFIVCIVAGYLLGCINSAILISKNKYNDDIRGYGSKNAGMTNMLRVYGSGAAGLTFLFDALKTVCAYIVGTSILGIRGAYFACFMCIVGHIFPIFFKFHGGKGVVCTAVTVLLLDPLAFAVLFVIFVIVLLGLKFMSLASIVAMMLYPIVHRWMMGYMPGRLWLGSTAFTIMIAALVLWRHWPNMKRLSEKNESKTDIIGMIKEKIKKKKQDTSDE